MGKAYSDIQARLIARAAGLRKTAGILGSSVFDAVGGAAKNLKRQQRVARNMMQGAANRAAAARQAAQPPSPPKVPGLSLMDKLRAVWTIGSQSGVETLFNNKRLRQILATAMVNGPNGFQHLSPRDQVNFIRAMRAGRNITLGTLGAVGAAGGIAKWHMDENKDYMNKGKRP